MRFLGFLLRRVVGIAAVMIGVSVITFAISHVIPADPVAAALGDHATDAQIAQFRAEGRLDTFVPPPPTRTGLYVLDSILAGDVEALRSSLVHLVLPALTLGYFSTAVIARMTRSSMLDVLGQDYMRTARAKGLREPVIVLRHALRNALIPTIP